MNRWLLFVMSLALAGCTITVTPITKKPVPHKYVKHSQKSKTKSAATSKPNNYLIVDSDWLIQYRQLEQAHGDYRLSDDAKVEPVGDGKFKVTHAMMNHFTDLSQTPVVTPTPR
jgi:hypothetical protein